MAASVTENEVEVEGVGIMRHLNDWQILRLRKMAKGPNRNIAPLAFGLGMTVQQFKKLAPEQKRAAWDAHNRLMDLAGGLPPRSAAEQRPRIPRAWERISEARMIELGRELIQIKARLPHGHFGLWVEEKSGITYSQAQRFMKAARETDAAKKGQGTRAAA
jgi:hypothetical protein